MSLRSPNNFSGSFFRWPKTTDGDILFMAWYNTVNILSTRGFRVNENEQRMKYQTYEEYLELKEECMNSLSSIVDMREQISGMYYKKERKKIVDRIYVRYISQTKDRGQIKKATMAMIVKECQEADSNCKHIFIVPTGQVYNDALSFASAGFNIEYYDEKLMCINRGQHVFNPIFTQLTPEESAKKFSKLTNKPESRFSRIQPTVPKMTDPYILYHDPPPGTVVKIQRTLDLTDQIATHCIDYRIVAGKK